jgi:hypothetical protein
LESETTSEKKRERTVASHDRGSASNMMGEAISAVEVTLLTWRITNFQ